MILSTFHFTTLSHPLTDWVTFLPRTRAPVGGQALVWDDVVERWSPNNIVATTANLDANFLHELSDVSNTTPTDDQILKYSTTTNRWELGSDINDITDKSLGELQDVDIVSPSFNSYLKWTGAEWVGISDIVSEGLGSLTDRRLTILCMGHNICRFSSSIQIRTSGNHTMTL